MRHARSDDAAIRVARRTLGAFALVGTTAVVWFGFVDPAGANAPTVKASCVGGQSVLTVEVRDYDGRVTNTVSVQDNQRVLDNQRFKSSYRNSFIRPGNVEHVYRVVVSAGNDRTGDQGFSFVRSVPQPVCEQATITQTRAQEPPIFGIPMMPMFPAPSAKTTTTTTPPPVTTTTTPPPPPPITTTTTAVVPPAAPPVVVEPPARTGSSESTSSGTSSSETTTTTTKFLPALVPPLVSLIEPPSVASAEVTSGSARTPAGGSSSSASSSTRGTAPAGASGASGTSSSSTTAPEGTSKSNVLVIADDTTLPTTGASVALPLLFGLCLLTAGGVVVFSMRTTRKRGRHAA
jgi:LPXTG-motif cell wall-anchored protein